MGESTAEKHATQRTPAEIKGILFYTQQDICLGQFILDNCMQYSKFTGSSTQKIEQTLCFVHRPGRIDVTVRKTPADVQHEIEFCITGGGVERRSNTGSTGMATNRNSGESLGISAINPMYGASTSNGNGNGAGSSNGGISVAPGFGAFGDGGVGIVGGSGSGSGGGGGNVATDKSARPKSSFFMSMGVGR
jgi:hypothetical protein